MNHIELISNVKSFEEEEEDEEEEAWDVETGG